MPYHKQKYASKDYVMCNCCKKRLMRQNVDSHYETFNKTKDGIIEHDTHVGLRYCELTDPSDVTSASIPSIKVRGLSSYFATKSKPNDTDDRHDDTTVTAPKASHKPELCEPKPQTKSNQTALIEGSIVYDCEECGFGMCEECLVLLRSENHAESTAIEDRNADLLKLEDLFIGLYDSNGLEIVECDALTITKLVVKSMVKSSELIVSGLHFCLRYPSWIDEIHSIFLIRYYLKDECSEETLLFLTKLAEDYLSSHRSPLTTHRSKYGIHGEVLTKLMRSADAKVDLTELVAQLHALKSINITDLNNNSDEDIDVEMDVSLNDEEMYDEGVMHDESVLHDGNTAGLNIEMDLSESEHSEEEKHDILDDDL
eukprot:865657_1